MVKKQNGFAHIGVILAVVLLIMGISYAGWYIKEKNSSTTSPSAVSAKNESQQKPEAVEQPKVKVIPGDWQQFTNKDGSVTFAYPKTWGVLTEIAKAEAPGYYDNGSFMRPVVITSKSDFLIQVRQGYYDPTWYAWGGTTDGLVTAKDEKAPEVPSMDYVKPVSLGRAMAVEPHVLSGVGKQPIYYVLGKGAMNCGARHYFFDIKDKVVHISATLCNRGGEWEPQAGQQYIDVVEDPLKNIYEYINE